MSHSINSAILLAMELRLISSTTLLMNMDGFHEACELAQQRPILGKVGLHLNLCEGFPLTMPIRECGRFCDSHGRFLGNPMIRAIRLTRQEAMALEIEMERQIKKCLDAGIHVTHLDSHMHYHTSWPIGGIAIRTAKRMGIQAVRLNGDCRAHISFIRSLYIAIFNYRLRLHGLAKTDHFASIADIHTRLSRLKGIVEICVHPRMHSDGRLVDLDGLDLQTLINGLGVLELVPYPK
jgi:predicted glycoside hydrolase/deacetylase ChbG (UPF0249 family)